MVRALYGRAILTVVLALGGCRQLLGLEEPLVIEDASVDGPASDASIDAFVSDRCDYQFDLAFAVSGNLAGLATANDVLYGFDLGPPSQIVSLDQNGTRTLIRSVFFASAGLAASGTHLYADDEASGQVIHELLISDTSVQRTIPSPITGGNRGLAFVDDRLWHLGAFGSTVGFSELKSLDGSLITHHPLIDTAGADNADSDGTHILYVTSNVDAGMPIGTLHVLDLFGTLLCSRDLPLPESTDSYDLRGLAADGKRLYLYDRSASSIYVLSAL